MQWHWFNFLDKAINIISRMELEIKEQKTKPKQNKKKKQS